MKKIFSTVAMAIVALVSVVSMTSCNNDDTSSFNAAPSVAQASAQTTYNYTYQANVTSDVLTYFDVVVTRTNGSESQNIAFSNAVQLKNNKAGMQAKDSFSSTKGGTKYNVTVTPKSNWKELLDANKTNSIYVAMELKYTSNSVSLNGSNGGGFDINSLDDMNTAAKLIAENLTPKQM